MGTAAAAAVLAVTILARIPRRAEHLAGVRLLVIRVMRIVMLLVAVMMVMAVVLAAVVMRGRRLLCVGAKCTALRPLIGRTEARVTAATAAALCRRVARTAKATTECGGWAVAVVACLGQRQLSAQSNFAHLGGD